MFGRCFFISSVEFAKAKGQFCRNWTPAGMERHRKGPHGPVVSLFLGGGRLTVRCVATGLLQGACRLAKGWWRFGSMLGNIIQPSLRKEGMLCEVTVNDIFVLDGSDVRSSAGLWNVSVVLMLRVCCFGSQEVHLATCHGSRAQSCAKSIRQTTVSTVSYDSMRSLSAVSLLWDTLGGLFTVCFWSSFKYVVM